MNRESFGHGPWDNEPDRLEWTTAAGYPGLIVRNRMGSLCGYAAVPPSHPLYGSDGEDLSCHGGVTYTGKCSGHICHVPAPGEPDDVWWFGFDCAHAWDLIPSMSARWTPARAGEYRTVAYVTNEVEELAEQLKGMS